MSEPSGHTVDSARHPTGEHARWEEIKRLRALLREGTRLLEKATYEPHLPGEKDWLARVRKELGE